MKTNAQKLEIASKITLPAEWAPHKAMWTAWPSHPDLWMEDLPHAQTEVAAMVRALAADGLNGRKGDHVRVLACGDEFVASAKKAIGDVAEIIPAKFGDIWLRDTGPVWAKREGRVVALRFKTNGWGGKYDFPDDRTVGDFIAKTAGTPVIQNDIVLEGGSLEYDGDGTLLTTRQCLQNENRNADLSADEIEEEVKRIFGVEKVLWLDEGLANDHTDGHIDNIARFCAPGHVICQEAYGDDDPNVETHEEIARALSNMTDARGRKLKVSRIPSPGLLKNASGLAVPASHMNYIVGNASVVVPTYGTKSADLAVKALGPLFSGRRIIGCSARYIQGIDQEGGGAFHCITQQEPAE